MELAIKIPFYNIILPHSIYIAILYHSVSVFDADSLDFSVELQRVFETLSADS